jgi:phospholipase C
MVALGLALVGCSADSGYPDLSGWRPGPDLGGIGGGSDGFLGCPSPVQPDSKAAARRSCSYKSGDLPENTLDVSFADRQAIPIKHIIVIVKENRSFDHLLGGLHFTRPDVETWPNGFSMKDCGPGGALFCNQSLGTAVQPFHYGDTCDHLDPNHSWDSMHKQVNGGAMDGYIAEACKWMTISKKGMPIDGHSAIGYFDQTDFPFYYWLTDTFAIADHYFSSVRGPTYPNRDYLVLGTSGGVQETTPLLYPQPPSLPTIFDRLDAAKVPWGVFAASTPFEDALNNEIDDAPKHDWSKTHTWGKPADFFAKVANNTLPSVVYLDSSPNSEDDHPYSDVQVGEAWLKNVYDAVSKSAFWNDTAILVTYDEAGGFFDHLPPPNDWCAPSSDNSKFTELGTRVPLYVISPWARRHYVSKTNREHTSILKFIETVFDLPALTARDANSDALLDMFDFKCQPQPISTPPASGTGHCSRNQDAGVPPDLSPLDLGPSVD